MSSARFVWPSRDRPELLSRSLVAWDRGLSAAGMAPSFLVCDGSSDGGVAARRALGSLASRRGGIYLAGHEARLGLAAALGAARPGLSEVSSFALGLRTQGDPPGPGTYGANRNFALLLSAGLPFASLDDDVLPEFRQPFDVFDGVLESDEGDPTLISPYSNAEELEEASEAVSVFPATLYEALFQGAFPARESGESAGVLSFSSWGDSGLGSNRYLLTGRNAVDSRNYEEEDAYEAAMAGRTLFRAPTATVVGGLFLMTMHCLFDAREVLPPFLPLGRGEDSLWAAYLSLLHPERPLATSPLAVNHAPGPRPSGGRERAWAWSFGLSDLLLFLTAQSAPRGTRMEYETVSARFQSYGRLASSELEDLILTINRQALESRIRVLEGLLLAFDREPGFWAADIDGALAVLGEALESKEPRFPEDLPDPKSLATFLGDWGRLLEYWRELFALARELSPRILESCLLKA